MKDELDIDTEQAIENAESLLAKKPILAADYILQVFASTKAKQCNENARQGYSCF